MKLYQLQKETLNILGSIEGKTEYVAVELNSVQFHLIGLDTGFSDINISKLEQLKPTLSA